MKRLLIFAILFAASFAATKQMTSEEIAQEIGEMFRFLSEIRYQRGDFGGIARRPVFLKPHICAQGTFEVSTDIPEDLQEGIFQAGANYPIEVRFSSDTIPTEPDYSDQPDKGNHTIGFAMKLSDIPSYTNGLGEVATQQDFLTQNHDVFFVDTALDFLIFNQYIFGRFPGKTLNDYLNDHPQTAQILGDMSKEVSNILETSFWSVTPYQFGSDKWAKYKITPCDSNVTVDEQPDATDPNYLQSRLTRDLQKKSHCFDFAIQLQTNNEDMPIDKATTRWCEQTSKDKDNECFAKSASPAITVARIHLPIQDDLPELFEKCEHMNFNPGRAHPSHQVAGSLNKARAFVYSLLAAFRKDTNFGD